MISDLTSNEAAPAYGHVTRPVKVEAGTVATVRSVCLCCGRPISLRIGPPVSRKAPVVSGINAYAQKLIGTSAVDFRAEFAETKFRTVGHSQNGRYEEWSL